MKKDLESKAGEGISNRMFGFSIGVMSLALVFSIIMENCGGHYSEDIIYLKNFDDNPPPEYFHGVEGGDTPYFEIDGVPVGEYLNNH